MLNVRRAGLERFGETAIKANQPMAAIEDVFVPLYLHHRYAVDSAVSVLGGQDYIYAMRGDGRTPTRWMPAAAQTQGARRAHEHAEAERAHAVIEPARQDPAAPAGLCRARASCFRARPAASSIRSARPSSPPTWSCRPADATIAPRAWWRSTRSIPRCPASRTSSAGRDDGVRSKAATPYEAEIKRAMERVVISQVMRWRRPRR